MAAKAQTAEAFETISTAGNKALKDGFEKAAAVFGDFNAFYIPLLFGGGVEYLVQPNLAITGKLKVGPTFGTNDFPTSFTLYVLVGAAYKF